MPKMAAQAVPDLNELTPYEVKTESWITDGRGHSQLRTPSAEGEDPTRVDLHPHQAEYLIASGQVAPIPGVTRGCPADGVTGEALTLSDEERRRIQEAPPLGDASERELGTSVVDPETPKTEGDVGSSGQQVTAADMVDATQTGGEETLKPTAQPEPVDTGTEATARATGKKSR